MFRSQRIARCAHVAILATVVTVFSSPSHSQSPTTPNPPSFDVASIKLHPGGAHVIDITTSGSRLTVMAEMLRSMIVYAYDLKGGYQVPVTPALSAFGDKSYDIEAEVDDGRTPTKTEFREMLKSLLADRFNLKVHDDMRNIDVYELSVGKNGPKFKESAPGEKFYGLNGVNGRNQTLTLTAGPIDDLVGILQVFTGRPVLDKTGLTGTYDIQFEATPQFRIDQNPDDAHDISALTAVKEQLGLKLQAAKDPVNVIIVDHVEEPSAN